MHLTTERRPIINSDDVWVIDLMAGLRLPLARPHLPIDLPLPVVQLSLQVTISRTAELRDNDQAQVSHVPYLTRCVRFVPSPGERQLHARAGE